MKTRPSAHARGYGRRWQKARLAFLAAHPCCRICEEQGRIIAATIVDHIEPHKGDAAKFWNVDNWQSLCANCNNSLKQQLETTGHFSGTNKDGEPLESTNSWYSWPGAHRNLFDTSQRPAVGLQKYKYPVFESDKQLIGNLSEICPYPSGLSNSFEATIRSAVLSYQLMVPPDFLGVLAWR
jgi:hypothetical protein